MNLARSGFSLRTVQSRKSMRKGEKFKAIGYAKEKSHENNPRTV